MSSNVDDLTSTEKDSDWNASLQSLDLSNVVVVFTLVLGAALILAFVYFSSRSPCRTADVTSTSRSKDKQGSDSPEVDSTTSQSQNSATEDFPYLDDVAEELERCKAEANSEENLISRIKVARQKAINKKIQESLTVNELKMEKIMESQQLAKIFSLLHDNEDKFGKMSIDDVKSQMTMYKES